MLWKVREGRESDASTIVSFQVRMAWESEELKLDQPTVEKGVAAVFADRSKGGYWVAETEEGEVIACLLTVPEWSEWRNGTVWWIHSVYVVPEARRKGVFRSMYAHLKKRVESREDEKGLRLYVEHNNEVAQAVYRAMGMTDEHYRLFEWLS
jgi:ribosomal protein S18 acetylase RimI-like enzyme